MKALVKNLGDQFNLPTTVVKDLDLDNFVEQAIKVEEGEIETLRVSPDQFQFRLLNSCSLHPLIQTQTSSMVATWMSP